MKNFEQPYIVPIGRDNYRLNREYLAEVTDPDTGHQIVIAVPKGFEYDGATAPDMAGVLFKIRRDGLNRAGALVHDWLYHNKGKVTIYLTSLTNADQADQNYTVTGPVKRFFNRKETDKIFYQLLIKAGVPRKSARLQYTYVRLLAWVVW